MNDAIEQRNFENYHLCAQGLGRKPVSESGSTSPSAGGETPRPGVRARPRFLAGPTTSGETVAAPLRIHDSVGLLPRYLTADRA